MPSNVYEKLGDVKNIRKKFSIFEKNFKNVFRKNSTFVEKL